MTISEYQNAVKKILSLSENDIEKVEKILDSDIFEKVMNSGITDNDLECIRLLKCNDYNLTPNIVVAMNKQPFSCRDNHFEGKEVHTTEVEFLRDSKVWNKSTEVSENNNYPIYQRFYKMPVRFGSMWYEFVGIMIYDDADYTKAVIRGKKNGLYVVPIWNVLAQLPWSNNWNAPTIEK